MMDYRCYYNYPVLLDLLLCGWIFYEVTQKRWILTQFIQTPTRFIAVTF